MNIKQTFQQTLREARSNPGFTLLYIGGVAFAVAFTMVFAIMYYVKLAPIYPEYSRYSTTYIKSLSVRNDAQSSESAGSVSMSFAEEFLSDTTAYDFYTVKEPTFATFVQQSDGRGDLCMLRKNVDYNFFRLYDYHLEAGKPLSQADCESNLRSAVVISDVAKRLYGSSEAAVGKKISISYVDYNIVGVVSPGSSLFTESFSQIFTPLAIGKNIDNHGGDMRRLLGQLEIAIKTKDDNQSRALRSHIDDMVRKVNAADTTGWQIKSLGIVSNPELVFRKDYSQTDLMTNLRPFLILLLVLLLVPSLNISSIISGQMDRRLAEIGLRRSFGGSKSSLCRQIMTENFILTLFGGLFGLILSWVIIYFFKDTILGLNSDSWTWIGDIVEARISAEMLFAPTVFFGALALCIILNILSAYIPVRLSLRKPIVFSLNTK